MFLTGAMPVRVFGAGPSQAAEPTTVVVDFANGSVLALTYAPTGSRRLPKERLEVFGGGRTWVVDDWRQLAVFGGGRTRKYGRWSQAKGYREEINAFVAAVRTGGPDPIPFEDLAATTRVTFCALESWRRKTPVDVPVV
jgi:predicted dehydrogenase